MSRLQAEQRGSWGNENGAPQMWTCSGAPVASYGLGGGACIGATIAQPLQPMRRALAPMVLTDITNTNPAVLAGKPPGFFEVVKNIQPTSFAGTIGGNMCPLPQPTLASGDSLFRITSTVPATGSTCVAFTPAVPVPDNMDVEAELSGADDPQNVAEYLQDIYSNLHRDEANFLPRADYMESQGDINAKMRAILIDWLVEVHMKYKMKNETLFLTVNLIDRYLDKRQPTRKQLQLVGVAAMLIAAKFEEIYPPEVRDFVYITDNAYTKDDILKMEMRILTTLNFVLCCPTIANFLDHYCTLNCCTDDHRHLVQYVLELTLTDHKMLRYSPSHLVAAAALLSNKLLKRHPAWPAVMLRQTKQTEAMVKGCAREMCGVFEAAERSPLQAVRKKFSQPKFSSIAKRAF